MVIRIRIQNYNFESEGQYDNGSDLRIEQGYDEIGQEIY